MIVILLAQFVYSYSDPQKVSPRHMVGLGNNRDVLSGVLVCERSPPREHDWPGGTQGWGPCHEICKTISEITHSKIESDRISQLL